jgi:predicted RNase H-like HicB family nuclease
MLRLDSFALAEAVRSPILIIESDSHRIERMLRQYLDAALRRATYEIIPDDGTFYGEIPGFEGVYSTAASLESCRDELQEVLEEWVFFRVSRNLDLPSIDGVELRVRNVG